VFNGTNDRGVRVTQIRRWSETVVVVDAGLKDTPVAAPSTSTHCWMPGQPSGSSSCRPNHTRHPGQRVSVGFTDGHAERLKMEKPFYPGPVGTFTPLNLTDPNHPDYQDELWDLY
jgi:prepilin-type processing-associated H-X9-DG protein